MLSILQYSKPFEKLEKVKLSQVGLSAKNEIVILLYGYGTNFENRNQEILENLMFYLKVTTRFDR